MAKSVVDLTCPGCGARISSDMKVCEWCHSPVIITEFNNVLRMPVQELNKYIHSYTKDLEEHPDSKDINFSIGMCYLKLRLYDKALDSFQKAMSEDINDSELYFYSAVCMLGGKKAFLTKRTDINKIEEYINAAIMLGQKGIYYYLLAYIKYDFYERKYLNTEPTYKACLQNAYKYGLSQNDKIILFEMLGVLNTLEL